MNVRLEPLGVPQPVALDRTDVHKVHSGDTLRVRVRLYFPDGTPATKENSLVEAVLVNQLFDDSEHRLWEGDWTFGVVPVDTNDHPGLVDITVPHPVTDALRRGQYLMGIRITSKLGAHTSHTVGQIHLLLDYSAVGTTHNIPYKV